MRLQSIGVKDSGWGTNVGQEVGDDVRDKGGAVAGLEGNLASKRGGSR